MRRGIPHHNLCLWWRWTVSGVLFAAGCRETTLPHLVQADQPVALAHEEEASPGVVRTNHEVGGSPRWQPLDLDMVLRLAEGRNPQIAVARAKLQAAQLEQELKSKQWLPDLYAGPAYYRHEGGIQDFQGNLVHSSYGGLFTGLEVQGRLDLREKAFQQLSAERKTLEQRGELSGTNHQQLSEAALLYLDLVTVRATAAVVREYEQQLPDLLEQAKKRARAAPASTVEVPRIESEIASQRQTLLSLDEKAAAASARLVYLLGLEACVEVRPIDQQLLPLTLVDGERPVCDFINDAVQRGPGIQELEAFVQLIDRSSQGTKLQPYIPTLEMRMAEGAFVAGPGGSADWDNRWDLALQARWNLSALAGVAAAEKKLASERLRVHLSLEELRAKLTAGIKAAHETVRGGPEQFRLGEDRIRLARQALDLSKTRVKNNIQGSSLSELMLAHQAVLGAQVSYVNLMASYDKAQLQLLLLSGK